MGNPAWIRELDNTYVYTTHGIRLIADAISCWLRLAFLLMLSTSLTDRIRLTRHDDEFRAKDLQERQRPNFQTSMRVVHLRCSSPLSPPHSHLHPSFCLLYTSDAADDLLCVDLGGRRIIKKKKNTQ